MEGGIKTKGKMTKIMQSKPKPKKKLSSFH